MQGWVFGPGDYGLFKDWSAIVWSRDGYICIRDGLVLEGEVQEMDDKENFSTRGRTRPVFVDISWRTTRCLLIVGGTRSVQRTWSVIACSR